MPSAGDRNTVIWTCPDSLLIWAKKTAIVWQRPRVWKAMIFENLANGKWQLANGPWLLALRLLARNLKKPLKPYAN
jgi:hypothetical protein